MADLSTEKKLNDLIREREQIEGRIGDLKKGPYKSTLNKLIDLEGKILKLQKQQSDEQAKKNKAAQAEQKIKNRSIALDQKLLKLSKSSTGQILESFNLMGGLEKSTMQAGKASGKLKEGYNLVSAAQLNAIEELKAGTFDAESYVENVKDELLAMGDEGAAVFNRMEKDLESFAQTVRDTPDIGEKLKVEAEAQAKMGAFKDKVKETSALLSSPKAMGVAALGLAAKIATDFASSMLDVRQSLGTSAVDSARIAGNMKLAGMNAKRFGGSVEQGAASVTSIAENFGSIDVISASVSMGLGRITGQFGLSGDNAGKLLKTMQGINGASIETNLATLETVGNLARAARVAPAAVLNDMAENSETFAKFSMKGGDNLAKAAIAARKLGLNLSTVDKIAESIMDIEGSIEREMEASMLIGRQMNLDKARQLVMEGDMVGVLAEVKRQAGGAAEFAKLNFVQRKALAASVGLEASEMAKLTNEQEAAVEAQEKQAKGSMKLAMGIGAIVGLAAALVPAILASIPGLQGVGLRGLAKGLGVAAAGAAGGTVLGAGVGKVMGMEKGGVVTQSGMAQVHKGEAFSGTRNEMGMGNGQTNILLKQLIKQNEVLMNRLTSRISDIALSSAV